MANSRSLPILLITAVTLTVFTLTACISSKPTSDNDNSIQRDKSVTTDLSTRKGGKVVVAAPTKVCRAAGGEFANSFPVMDLGEAFLQVITSIELNEKLVKTGDKLHIKIFGNGKTLPANALRKRTSEFVVTDKSGFSHILLFSGQTIKVKVFPGEKLSIQDPFMRNFGRRACVKLRPERIPDA